MVIARVAYVIHCMHFECPMQSGVDLERMDVPKLACILVVVLNEHDVFTRLSDTLVVVLHTFGRMS